MVSFSVEPTKMLIYLISLSYRKSVLLKNSMSVFSACNFLIVEIHVGFGVRKTGFKSGLYCLCVY